MTNWTSDILHKEIISQNRIALFQDLYGKADAEIRNFDRILSLLKRANFSKCRIFSAPGRTELGGNHTDHNLGKVLCAAVQNDTLAVVSKRNDAKIIVHSEGFNKVFVLDIADLRPRSSENGTTMALIRGMLDGIEKFGGQLGGFAAEVNSTVDIGSGLSSSASFEVLIGTIINDLYNDNQIPATEIARIGQYAENVHFGKPCGLMDQTASAVGGTLKIDFANPESVDIHKIDFNWSTTDYDLLIINTGGNHANLTGEYAAIPEEMCSVARELGSNVLRSQEEDSLLRKIGGIRAKLGDRAVLRAFHFFSENRRVDQMDAALSRGDFDVYLANVSASGLSSQNILQNAIPHQSDARNQGLTFALGISQLFFEKKGRGVARVHGGGFAGAIQAYVHKQDYGDYVALMNQCLGASCVERLKIRQNGAGAVVSLE